MDPAIPAILHSTFCIRFRRPGQLREELLGQQIGVLGEEAEDEAAIRIMDEMGAPGEGTRRGVTWP